MNQLFMRKSSVLMITMVGLLADPVFPHSEETQEKSLGERTYFTYCALCHGVGRGPGMFADALKKAAPDLTEIAKRNGGQFPDEEVSKIIRDGGISGHGTMRLLSWEDYFRDDNTAADADRLVQELTAYLKAHQTDER